MPGLSVAVMMIFVLKSTMVFGILICQTPISINFRNNNLVRCHKFETGGWAPSEVNNIRARVTHIASGGAGESSILIGYL